MNSFHFFPEVTVVNKKVLFVVLCVLLVVLLTGAVLVYNELYEDYTDSNYEMQTVEKDNPDVEGTKEDTKQNSQEGENTVPDVEFFDADGNAVMLSDFFDKPVVLNFWATWCGPCKSEMPGFDRLYNKYKDKVNFVMLNVSDSEETVADFLEENGYGFPVYFDKTQIAAYTYGASSIPLTFVMYKGGEVYGYQMGVLPEDALEEALNTVLTEE